jgi:hypothetical protein
MPTLDRLKSRWMAAAALCEFLRYDILVAIGGFPLVRKTMPRSPKAGSRADEPCRLVCEAITRAATLYWKPVLCLQSAMVTARLLRRRGIAAEVVIGCRPEPFFSHAWVEANGRVVNDSPLYQQQLPALARL